MDRIVYESSVIGGDAGVWSVGRVHGFGSISPPAGSLPGVRRGGRPSQLGRSDLGALNWGPTFAGRGYALSSPFPRQESPTVSLWPRTGPVLRLIPLGEPTSFRAPLIS